MKTLYYFVRYACYVLAAVSTSTAFAAVFTSTAHAAGVSPSRPNIVLTAKDAALIRANLGKYPLFDAKYKELKTAVDNALAQPIDVPVPVDAGGYTHGRHKQNYKDMYGAGVLFSITGDARYAKFVREMLLKYAALYPTLGNHPAGTGPAPGRLFWQTLNEAVWLMNVAQAYDCVYDALSATDRTAIESRLLRPMAKFFSVDHVKEFDRIHNHGTWTATAVAMLGYALRDQSLVDLALYGTQHNKTGGFFRQLDLLGLIVLGNGDRPPAGVEGLVGVHGQV